MKQTIHLPFGLSITAESTNEEFYRLGLREFRKAQKHGYPPPLPRGARGSRNALYLLAHGWARGKKAAVGFIRCQFWIHASVSEVCDTTGALYETRRARKTGRWENGDVFDATGNSTDAAGVNPGTLGTLDEGNDESANSKAISER